MFEVSRHEVSETHNWMFDKVSAFFLSVSIPALSRWLIIERVPGKEMEEEKKPWCCQRASLLVSCLLHLIHSHTLNYWCWHFIFWIWLSVKQSRVQSEQRHQNKLNVVDQRRYGWSTQPTGSWKRQPGKEKHRWTNFKKCKHLLKTQLSECVRAQAAQTIWSELMIKCCCSIFRSKIDPTFPKWQQTSAHHILCSLHAHLLTVLLWRCCP